MRVSDLLRREHRDILRTLNVLERMATRTSQGEAINRKDAREIVALLKGFADRYHQGKEEAVLFPALLKDPGQEHYDQLCCLIFEHDQERSLIEGLEEAIETNNTKEFLFCANRIIETTRAHIHTEDTVLLKLADSVLSPLDDELVATELREFEHAWQQQVLSVLLKRLAELEVLYETVAVESMSPIDFSSSTQSLANPIRR